MNSGQDRILNGCKKYMGDNNTGVENQVNNELIDLGKQPHKYTYGNTFDKMLPDHNIKQFLQNYLNATSWDSVSASIKKVCYRNYPIYQLSNCDNIHA